MNSVQHDMAASDAAGVAPVAAGSLPSVPLSEPALNATEPLAAPLDTAAPEPAEGAWGDEGAPSPVNYDDEGLLEVELDDLQFRLDAGKQGTALCISVRPLGTWTWFYRGEARWDGQTLRTKTLDRHLLERLGRSLRAAAADLE